MGVTLRGKLKNQSTEVVKFGINYFSGVIYERN